MKVACLGKGSRMALLVHSLRCDWRQPVCTASHPALAAHPSPSTGGGPDPVIALAAGPARAPGVGGVPQPRPAQRRPPPALRRRAGAHQADGAGPGGGCMGGWVHGWVGPDAGREVWRTPPTTTANERSVTAQHTPWHTCPPTPAACCRSAPTAMCPPLPRWWTPSSASTSRTAAAAPTCSSSSRCCSRGAARGRRRPKPRHVPRTTAGAGVAGLHSRPLTHPLPQSLPHPFPPLPAARWRRRCAPTWSSRWATWRCASPTRWSPGRVRP